MTKQQGIPGLDIGAPAKDGAITILWTRFEELWAQLPLVVKNFDADAVHDMRVASRRLRTGMQTFRPCFPGKAFRAHYACIRDIADLLGEVRDRDILIHELCGDRDALPEEQRSGLSSVIADVEAERDRSREALRTLLEALQNQLYDRSFLSFLARSA